MGSSGSGNFSDYSGGASGKKGGGGSSGNDRCERAVSTVLEEVAQCEYFSKHKKVPPPQTQLSLILNERLFAVDADGLVVGALSTGYNYLAACMEDGFSYVGIVNTSRSSPVPFVGVDFRPE